MRAKPWHGPPPHTSAVSIARSSIKYQLVPQEKLEEAKVAFDSVTACHPYSLHSSGAQSGDALYVLNQTQDRKLYDGVRKQAHPYAKQLH